MTRKDVKTKGSFTFLLLFLVASFAVASQAGDWAEGEVGLSALNIDPTPNWEEGERAGVRTGAVVLKLVMLLKLLI